MEVGKRRLGLPLPLCPLFYLGPAPAILQAVCAIFGRSRPSGSTVLLIRLACGQSPCHPVKAVDRSDRRERALEARSYQRKLVCFTGWRGCHIAEHSPEPAAPFSRCLLPWLRFCLFWSIANGHLCCLWLAGICVRVRARVCVCDIAVVRCVCVSCCACPSCVFPCVCLVRCHSSSPSSGVTGFSLAFVCISGGRASLPLVFGSF